VTETFAEYTARLLSLSAGADPFAVLESTPARIEAKIAGRRDDDLRQSPSPSRWSVAQILAHLADSEIVFAYRLRMILASSGTTLQAYDQDAWSRAQRAEASDPRASLTLFSAIRASTVRLLRSLDAEELERYGLHAERGKETVRHLLALYAGHDRNHLAQIERLLT
jgi:uncharacterized damage-inducible protein DinB